MTLCRPLPYRLHVAPLERGRWNPRKGYIRLPRARARRRRDIRPMERVSSVTFGPVRPSPPLCHHPRHCSVIPGTVGAQDNETPPHPSLCILQPSVSPTLELTYVRRPNKKLLHHHLRSRPWTGTGLATTLARARVSRTTINSATLCAMSSNVALGPCSVTVNRLPFAYKRRRRSPGPEGGGATDSCTLAHFRPHPRYWHFTSIKP
jgi:hypothetical protein